MASTTVMTFLLCTGPHVRSVKLLGSWDNFSKPYVMERDKRSGAGHWRGCHTFTNITCDGTANNTAPARSGGLKMGGTYWYYYLLDDDIVYHNEAEPMTTHCPYLPGQPVNVLQVPVLPDTKPAFSRARSPSCQKAEQKMNPEDRYMNPREPPKPNVRLRTSPPALQAPAQNSYFSTSPLGAITNRDAAQPAHGTPKIKHPRNEEKTASRSVSPPRSKGLRAAFRQWNTSTPSLSSTPYPVDQDQSSEFLVIPRVLRSNPDDRLHVRSQSNDSYMRDPAIGNMYESRGSGLPFRRPVSAGAHDSASLTIQERRALNTKTADDSTPKNPLTLRMRQPCIELANAGGHLARPPCPPFMRRPLSTPLTPSMLRRKSYGMGSPEEPTTPDTVMNKRLPTLPNSPSSVMDEALRDLDEQEKALDMEALASHFSDFTETDSVHISGPCEKSRFSEWSNDSDIVSPESMTSSSTFNTKQEPPIPELEPLQLSNTAQDSAPSDPNTPHLTVGSEPSPAQVEDSPRFDAPVPRLTLALSPSDLNIPGLRINDEEELLEDSAESNPKRHAAFFPATKLKGLGLASPPATATRLPDYFRERSMTPTNDHSRYSMLLSQSVHMKETMDELSHLRNMIQFGAAPDLSEHKV